jgi:hypothetical protein
MRRPSRRQFFAGTALAPTALMITANAEAGGRRRGSCVPLAFEPQWPSPGGRPPMSYPPHEEWGAYAFTFPCTINVPIRSVHLEFVDRRTHRVRGTLTAWHLANTITYQPGSLEVRGLIVPHTRHHCAGIADIYITVNGCSPSTCTHQAVWYEYGEVCFSYSSFYAICADHPLGPYTEGSPYTIPLLTCTIPTGNSVRLDFKPSRNEPRRGYLEATSSTPSSATGTIVRDTTNGFSGKGAADISVTINDSEICYLPGAFCYKTTT